MRYTRRPLCRWTCTREQALAVDPSPEAQPRHVFTCVICKQPTADGGAGAPLTFVVGHDGALLAVGETLRITTPASLAAPRKRTAAAGSPLRPVSSGPYSIAISSSPGCTRRA